MLPSYLVLTCKAALGAINSLEYVQDIDYNPLTAARCDQVAVLRQAIRAVSRPIHMLKTVPSYRALDQSLSPTTSILQCSGQNVENDWPSAFTWCWNTVVIDSVNDWTWSRVTPSELSFKLLFKDVVITSYFLTSRLSTTSFVRVSFSKSSASTTLGTLIGMH